MFPPNTATTFFRASVSIQCSLSLSYHLLLIPSPNMHHPTDLRSPHVDSVGPSHSGSYTTFFSVNLLYHPEALVLSRSLCPSQIFNFVSLAASFILHASIICAPRPYACQPLLSPSSVSTHQSCNHVRGGNVIGTGHRSPASLRSQDTTPLLCS